MPVSQSVVLFRLVLSELILVVVSCTSCMCKRKIHKAFFRIQKEMSWFKFQDCLNIHTAICIFICVYTYTYIYMYMSVCMYMCIKLRLQLIIQLVFRICSKAQKKKKFYAGRCEMLLLWYGRMLVTLKVLMSKTGTGKPVQTFCPVVKYWPFGCSEVCAM